MSTRLASFEPFIMRKDNAASTGGVEQEEVPLALQKEKQIEKEVW